MSQKTAISPKRSEDFNEWYQQVVYAASLAEHSPVRGCMVIKPWGYAIWERIQGLLDREFKQKDVENIYCPLLIPLSFLAKEAAHVSGFAKECAVVTHHRLEVNDAGDMVPAAPLNEPYVIRPTSEAMMGHIFAQWVQSYRDLPLKINQWANVMRWEMRPRLFLRTSEFLWQEGHTAHASAQEAQSMAEDMIYVYQNFFESILAIPVVCGQKSESERFAGADITWTIEAIMQDSKALQAGTSHFLGQHFSQAFDIQYTSKQNTIEHVWTTSWGVSTRMIGGIVMSHADDDGLMLPPRIAPYQIVIVPMIKDPADEGMIMSYITALQEALAAKVAWGEHIRVHVDKRDMAAGDKKWCWIKRGVPLRLDIGKKEVEALAVTGQVRHNLQDKFSSTQTDLIVRIDTLMKDIQDHIWSIAHARHHQYIQKITDGAVWKTMDKTARRVYLVPWAGSAADEEGLSDNLTIRCMLYKDHPLVHDTVSYKCVVTGAITDYWAMIATAY